MNTFCFFGLKYSSPKKRICEKLFLQQQAQQQQNPSYCVPSISRFTNQSSNR